MCTWTYSVGEWLAQSLVLRTELWDYLQMFYMAEEVAHAKGTLPAVNFLHQCDLGTQSFAKVAFLQGNSLIALIGWFFPASRLF